MKKISKKELILPEINTKIPEQNSIEIINEEELKEKKKLRNIK